MQKVKLISTRSAFRWPHRACRFNQILKLAVGHPSQSGNLAGTEEYTESHTLGPPLCYLKAHFTMAFLSCQHFFDTNCCFYTTCEAHACSLHNIQCNDEQEYERTYVKTLCQGLLRFRCPFTPYEEAE